MRILIYGNSGSGKSTIARRLSQEQDLPYLDLDTIAWSSPGIRLDTARSEARLRSYMAENRTWVVEGCYGSLIRVATEQCSELHFLNPGIEVCVERNRSRAWEPHKYPSKAAQDENLAMLLDWVRGYETRPDEYSLSEHRAIFDGFTGKKQEHK